MRYVVRLQWCQSGTRLGTKDASPALPAPSDPCSSALPLPPRPSLRPWELLNPQTSTGPCAPLPKFHSACPRIVSDPATTRESVSLGSCGSRDPDHRQLADFLQAYPPPRGHCLYRKSNFPLIQFPAGPSWSILEQKSGCVLLSRPFVLLSNRSRSSTLQAGPYVPVSGQGW